MKFPYGVSDFEKLITGTIFSREAACETISFIWTGRVQKDYLARLKTSGIDYKKISFQRLSNAHFL